MDYSELSELRNELDAIPVGADKCIESEFHGWYKGTSLDVILKWFDIRHRLYQGLGSNFTLEELEALWTELGDIPIDDDECIDEDFYIWDKGTDRYHIWHWFDDICPNGLAIDLMYVN